MSDDLVSDLRLNAEHQLLSVEDYRRAADRIEQLEAALRKAATVADNWGNSCIADICRKALEGKDD